MIFSTLSTYLSPPLSSLQLPTILGSPPNQPPINNISQTRKNGYVHSSTLHQLQPSNHQSGSPRIVLVRFKTVTVPFWEQSYRGSRNFCLFNPPHQPSFPNFLLPYNNTLKQFLSHCSGVYQATFTVAQLISESKPFKFRGCPWKVFQSLTFPEEQNLTSTSTACKLSTSTALQTLDNDSQPRRYIHCTVLLHQVSPPFPSRFTASLRRSKFVPSHLLPIGALGG